MDCLSLFCWCLPLWLLLSGTVSTEVLVTGVAVAVFSTWVLVPLGGVRGPSALLRPKRVLPVAKLAGTLSWQVCRANLVMARRVWSREPPPRTGMVVVTTQARGLGPVAAVGLLTSLVVDNQVVDVDLASNQMLYHCLDVPPAGKRYDDTIGPIEGRVLRVAEGS
jgi:multicomponent Na+:H+ antiporter subunit E